MLPVFSYVLKDRRNPRARARKIDLITLVDDASSAAAESGEPAILCRNGGGVANAYKDRASTQCGLAVALPEADRIIVLVWAGECDAHKMGPCKAAGACLDIASSMYDGRLKPENQLAATEGVLAYAKTALQSLACKQVSELEGVC